MSSLLVAVDPKFTGGSIRQAASSKAIDEGWEVAAVLNMGMWKSFATWNRLRGPRQFGVTREGIHRGAFSGIRTTRKRDFGAGIGRALGIFLGADKKIGGVVFNRLHRNFH